MQLSLEKLTGALVIITALGVYVGYEALMEYKRANMESVNGRIFQMDNERYKLSIENDNLNAIFAYFPNAKNSEEVIINSKKLVALSISKENREKNCNCSVAQWDSVEQLYEIVWGGEGYDKCPCNADLRKASTHADLILYTVGEAHSAYKVGLMEKKDYMTWAAYVLDVGINPLFLLSVFIAHEGGYIDVDFAYELREILIKNDKTAIVVETIYPEMYKNKKWANKVGEKYINKHKPTAHAR